MLNSIGGPQEATGDTKGKPGRASAARGEGGDLSREMQTLTSVIKDLEDQLDRMVAMNEALRKDLESERQARIALQSRLDELEEQLRRANQDAAGKENLAAEVAQLNQERSRLGASLREMTQRLAQTQQERVVQQQAVERLRASRADALEEVKSVESQFERAMELVAYTKAQLAVVSEERDAQVARVRAAEEAQRQAMEDRDALQEEVSQSRAALDEIRRSLFDACVVSSGGLPDGEARRERE